MDEEFKATFLLCTLSESWDIFKTAMSNSNAMLLYDDVESTLFMEEMNRQNNASNKSSSALHTRGRSQQKGKSNSRDTVNHVVRMLNAIIVARRVTSNMTATTNEEKRKGKARR